MFTVVQLINNPGVSKFAIIEFICDVLAKLVCCVSLNFDIIINFEHYIISY